MVTCYAVICNQRKLMKNIKYPYLPEGVEVLYTPLTGYMKEAFEIAKSSSTDMLQPTGAVIVKDSIVLGSGSNQTPLPNDFLRELHGKGVCVRKQLKIASGTKYWMCLGCAKPHHHAEQRAVRNALDRGFDLSGAELYLWGHWWACKPCWEAMLAQGIKKLYMLEESEILFNPHQQGNMVGK